LLTLTDAMQNVSERVATTYQMGTNENVRGSNALGGSGVTFNDADSPLSQIWLKLLYTVFSPFPWAGGSMGFQIGKLDMLLVCFLLVRTVSTLRTKENSLIVLMMLTFIAPTTLMYATSISNVGLIVRQRLPIVAALVFLASLYHPA